MIKAAQGRGLISGFRLSRNGDPANILAYADDCVLLAKASLSEAYKIEDILNLYCRLSGEKVNPSKSDIIFWKTVHRRFKKLLCQALKMKEAKLPVKYLLGSHC